MTAEACKKTRVSLSQQNSDGGAQKRQLLEAGVSTHSNKIVLRSDKNEPRKDDDFLSNNKFKPANHVQTCEKTEEDCKINGNHEGSNQNDPQTGGKRGSLHKARSFGTSPCRLRKRGTKNSNRYSANLNSANKSLDESIDPESEDDALMGKAKIARFAHPALIDDDRNSKTNHKSSRHLAQSKYKEDQVNHENSDNSHERKSSRDKISSNRKEKICLEWVKHVTQLENQLDITSLSTLCNEKPPEFCSNKSCPISEYKILKTPKLLRSVKKVILRKAVFKDNDERWY